jgi:hypothetical protein
VREEHSVVDRNKKVYPINGAGPGPTPFPLTIFLCDVVKKNKKTNLTLPALSAGRFSQARL